MDEDLDSGLMVNFTRAPKRKESYSYTENPKHSQQAAHEILSREYKEDKSTTKKDNTPFSLNKKPSEDGRKQEGIRHEGGKQEEGRHRGKPEAPSLPAHGVISSLFRTNPDIPKVKMKKVKQRKEKLFSSDDFNSVELHPYMVSNLEKLGFTKLTSVQQETIPKIMDGHDVLVKSQTGSGKTMAYAIPIIEDLAGIEPKIKRQDGILAVILVPTRELAVQSFEVFQKLLKPFIWVVPGCLMGGEQRKAEKARLRKGVNILIATPGRMIDHMQNTANLELGGVRWLVLDEADRLLDMGFEAQVSRIVTSIDLTNRQTVLLSATLTEGVERLAGMTMKDPQRVAIKDNNADGANTSKADKPKQLAPSATNTGTESVTASDGLSDMIALPESLKQLFVIVPSKMRLVCLLILILSKCKKSNKTKMIVFISTQDAVEFLYRLVHYLSVDHQSSDVEDEDNAEPETSLNLFRLHGDMAQKDRTTTFQEFCVTTSGVLLCTDVAARGLHLPSVQWVIQYMCPSSTKDYVHRAGRTARAGTAGTSLMFLMPSEVKFVEHLARENISLSEMKNGKLLADVMKLVPSLPGLEESNREIPKTQEEGATYLQYCCENYVRKNKDMEGLAKKAYQSCVRAYATYPSQLKSIFHVKYLHLGHVAKTFGLRDAPSNMTGVPGLQQKQQSRKRAFAWDREENEGHGSKPTKTADLSEFSGAPVYNSSKMAKKMKKKVSKKLKSKRKV